MESKQGEPGWHAPEWLKKEWHSDFCPCIDLCREMQERALSRRLTDERAQEVGGKISRLFELQREIDGHSKEGWRRMREELFPLWQEIVDYWREHGYGEVTFEENGEMGIKDIDGSVMLPAEYEDAHFCFDSRWMSPYRDDVVVKKHGQWGVVDKNGDVLLPFEYDNVYHIPESMDYYVVEKEGKQGLINLFGKAEFNPVPVNMDTLYYVQGWDLVLFTRDGKWGWWWYEPDDSNIYDNYSEPRYDQIYVQRDEYRSHDDEDDDFIIAHKGNQLYWILYWTIK